MDHLLQTQTQVVMGCVWQDIIVLQVLSVIRGRAHVRRDIRAPREQEATQPMCAVSIFTPLLARVHVCHVQQTQPHWGYLRKIMTTSVIVLVMRGTLTVRVEFVIKQVLDTILPLATILVLCARRGRMDLRPQTRRPLVRVFVTQDITVWLGLLQRKEQECAMQTPTRREEQRQLHAPLALYTLRRKEQVPPIETI